MIEAQKGLHLELAGRAAACVAETAVAEEAAGMAKGGRALWSAGGLSVVGARAKTWITSLKKDTPLPAPRPRRDSPFPILCLLLPWIFLYNSFSPWALHIVRALMPTMEFTVRGRCRLCQLGLECELPSPRTTYALARGPWVRAIAGLRPAHSDLSKSHTGVLDPSPSAVRTWWAHKSLGESCCEVESPLNQSQ